MSFIAWKCQNLLVCTWPSGMAAEVWALSDNDVTSLLPDICVTTYVDVISINQMYNVATFERLATSETCKPEKMGILNLRAQREYESFPMI